VIFFLVRFRRAAVNLGGKVVQFRARLALSFKYDS
jgi:hypothetical protein